MALPTWPITYCLNKRFRDLGLPDVTIGDCILAAFEQWLADQEEAQKARRALMRKRTNMDTIRPKEPQCPSSSVARTPSGSIA